MFQKIFTKDLFLLLYYLLFIIIGIVVFLIVRKVSKKDAKKKIVICLLFTYSLCFILPIEKIIDFIPINRNTVEEAFEFDNGFFKYNIIFKEKYKDTYFIIGKSVNKQNTSLKFAYYKKTKHGYRTLKQPSDSIEGLKIVNNEFIINYAKNKQKKLKGIFISRDGVENVFDDKTIIEDKYGTKFKYVTDKNGNPIKFGLSNNYVFFGVIDKDISDSYYILINGKKIKCDL